MTGSKKGGSRSRRTPKVQVGNTAAGKAGPAARDASARRAIPIGIGAGQPDDVFGVGAWHLGSSPRELAFARFQHAMICLSAAFYRNVGRNLAQLLADPNFSGEDSVLLQVIHSADRPKTITDLQHFTNRTDVANIQYSVRKLQRAGLIVRADSTGRSASYRLTPNGVRLAEAYVTARRALLEKFPDANGDLLARLESARNLMVILSGLYDHDARELLTHRMPEV